MKYKALLSQPKGSEAVFEIPRFSDISQALIDSLAGEHPGKKIAFRPRTPLFEDLGKLDGKLPETTFCQIGFIADPACISGAAPVKNDRFRSRPPKDTTELQHVVAQTYIDDFAKPWEQYLGTALTQENLRLLLSLSNPTNTTLVEDGRPAGLVAFCQMTDCIGTPVEQVSWVWVRKDLERNDRASVHSLLQSVLKRRAAKVFQAGVHLKNNRSQRFFVKLGFQPRCIHCVPARA